MPEISKTLQERRGGITIQMNTREEANKVSRTYVETSTYLLEEIDEMIQEGFYHDRTEAVNEALTMLIKQYKVSKLHAKDLRHAADQKLEKKPRRKEAPKEG
jgi:Arc/MetJ-type ribon-helix-helix transcriptional regulator